MAHYAFLDENNIVTEVIVGKDESEILDGLTPEEWYRNFRGQRCIRTSYNAIAGKWRNPETNEITNNPGFRKNYAGIGYLYDPIRDAFIPPKPTVGEWQINEETCLWEPIIESEV